MTLAAQADDAALVRRTLTGERDAFGILVKRYAAAVHAIALAHLQEGADAEDAAQEAFVRAYTRLGQCARPDRFAHWLLRIARNTALNRRAALRRRAADALHEATLAAGADAPDQRIEARARRVALKTALAQLRPVQREALLLYDAEGYDHREVAALLGISTFMSRRHVSAARRRMRELLGEEPE